MYGTIPATPYPHRKRAVIAVQVGVFMSVMLGFAALTVDVGVLYNTRADLQRAADAAALAGASAYITDDMMRVRTSDSGGALSTVVGMAEGRVSSFSGLNGSFGLSTTNVAPGDILAGWFNASSGSTAVHTNPAPKDYNAIGVTVRRQAGYGDGANGPIPLFFAPILGWMLGETQASAVAIFDDRVASITVTPEGSDLLPFTIDQDAFELELVQGGDQYAYNEGSGSISSVSDGIREIRLYPYPLSGSGYAEGDGNFGMLNIGTGNQGVSAEAVQIENGVPASDFEMEIGTSELTFSDADGGAITYDITGSPGLEATLKSVLSQKVGQVIGFFLHTNVVLSGSNATYTITQLRYGRVMDIRLTGAPSQRGFFVQPVSYAGGEVRVDPTAPSTGGLVGRLVLAQ